MYKKISQIDPIISRLIEEEKQRQVQTLIMIPSESLCPEPVLEALATPFSSIYAEGYPLSRFTSERWERGLAEDIERHASFSKRYHSRRFYQGTWLADIIESIAQERVARLLATDRIKTQDIHVNVQPLSGSPANLAVYSALLEVGEPVMGLALPCGGHLTHFSPFNRSGRMFRNFPYAPGANGQLDYDRMRKDALVQRPKIIVGGSTAFPWAFDWKRMREIADEVGAYLLADVAHPIGLIVAGYYPNPIEYAHVVTFTTHKTLLGPRSACIATANSKVLGRLIDKGVFPGEQGGPHINTIMGVAVAAKYAQTQEFKEIQRRTVVNAASLVESLKKRDVPIAFGGTNSHLLLIDLRRLKTKTGHPLNGDTAARILEEIGIVVNKNTIPGDETAGDSSAIRLGTTWLSQLGADESVMDQIAEVIANFLKSSYTFPIRTPQRLATRAKIEINIFKEQRENVKGIIKKLHNYEEKPAPLLPTPYASLTLRGDRTDIALSTATTMDVLSLKPGEGKPAFFLNDKGEILYSVWIKYQGREDEASQVGERVFQIIAESSKIDEIADYLSLLSSGYLLVDHGDIQIKVEGPFVIEGPCEINLEDKVRDILEKLPKKGMASDYAKNFPEAFGMKKPYFIGQSTIPVSLPQKHVWQWTPPLPPKKAEPGWVEVKGEFHRCTPLLEKHKNLGAKVVPFAGWMMPVSYPKGPIEEHKAVRTHAGIFDVGHMGVIEVKGAHAAYFLDMITTSHIKALWLGKAVYTTLPGPDGEILDDLIIYRAGKDRFLIILNAANAEKDIAWITAVNNGEVAIDLEAPWKELGIKVEIQNLKEPSSGDNQKLDLALQGPKSLEILLQWVPSADHKYLANLDTFELTQTSINGIPVVIARTGYTGAPLGFEILVHPNQALNLWETLTEKGKINAEPIGLGARDSLRCEAGLPLYGHDLGNDHLTLVEIGYTQYVKTHAKPFFIGRNVHKARLAKPLGYLIRFENTSSVVISHRFEEYSIQDLKGKKLGKITSMVYTNNSPNRQVGLGLSERPVPQGETLLMVRAKGNQVLGYVPVKVMSRYPTPQEIEEWLEVYKA